MSKKLGMEEKFNKVFETKSQKWTLSSYEILL